MSLSIACAMRNITSSLHHGDIICSAIGKLSASEYPTGTVIPGTPDKFPRVAYLKKMKMWNFEKPLTPLFVNLT